MGEVYRARDPRIDRDVAIKILPHGLAADPDRMRRFELESRAAGAVNHPNLVTIHDIGTDNGAPYLVMELLEGTTLRARIEEGITLRKAIEYAIQIVHGLAAAHEKGIVHRDLKPENIFVSRDGRVKILDFGLAKLVDTRASEETATVARETSPGTVMGTSGYMSPEQVRGEPLDSRTDIFSFGAILYEMLSGRRAFEGKSSADTMSAILREDPRDLADSGRFSPALQRIIHHCLEKNREERFQSARDLAFDLQSISNPASGPMPAVRQRLPVAWIAAAIAIALTAFTAYLMGRRTAAPAAAAVAPINFQVAQMTFQSGVESFASLAPDGKTFLYTAGARQSIFLQRVDGRNAINLTKDSPADDSEPAFSPDGSKIAFRSERDGGGLYVMGATGESVRRISDFGFSPAWSPDGKSIACATENVVFSPQARSVNSEIWIIDVATGQKRLALNTMRPAQPAWSPHGSRIAFFGLGENSRRDIYTIDATARDAKPKAVTDDMATDWNPVWSHDGRYIYFGSDRGGTMNLWRIAVDEKTGDRLGEPEAIPLPTRSGGHFSISQDDRHIAYMSLETASAIRRAPFGDVRGANVMSGSFLMFNFEYSPDGKSIAFSNFGITEDLFVANADGTGLRQVTSDEPRDRAPAWTPDGKHLLFYSNRSGKLYQIYRINLDGSGLTPVSEQINESLWFPKMSPDGKKVTTVSFADAYLLRLDGDTAKAAELIPRLSEDRSFIPQSWSADSRRVLGVAVRVADRQTDGGAFIYDIESKTFTKVRDHGTRARWLPGDKTILVQDGPALYVTDPSGRLLRQYPFPEPRPIVSRWIDPLWSDGKDVCWVEQLNEGDIWLATLK
jgi:Tol biopolymer transport system component